MNIARRVIILALAFLLVSTAAFSAEPTWWNPLGLGSDSGTTKPAKKPAKKPAAKEDSSWLKLPTFGGDEKKSTKKSTPRKSNEPSTLAKMNNSTKKFFANAKDSLTPGSKKTPSPKPTGYGSGGSQRTAKKEAKAKEESSGNILTSWWKKEPETKKPKTVPDFISGERP